MPTLSALSLLASSRGEADDLLPTVSMLVAGSTTRLQRDSSKGALSAAAVLMLRCSICLAASALFAMIGEQLHL
jgi:hypothetical protein